MDERDFEARVAARLHDRFDDAEPSDALRFRVSEAVRGGAPQVRRLRSLWPAAAAAAVIVGAVVVIWAIRPTSTAVVGGSPSPAATAIASPSVSSARPYRLSVFSGGSPGPTTSIATAADCDALPTEWLRSFCALTLRSDWRAIVAPDPLARPPNATTSVTWFASMARASIDGDTTLCSDVAMREWVTLGSGLGGAPPPGSTPAPVHPVAACLDYLRSTSAKGTFTITDPGHQDTVQISVDPGAGARAAGGSAPAFDPKLVCGQALTRDVCNQLVDAVTTALGSRQSGVQVLSGYAQPVGCSTSVTPCPPPEGGRWLGGVLVGLGGNEVLAFDVADVGGQVTATEVPYKP
jgi:hypothetical protein